MNRKGYFLAEAILAISIAVLLIVGSNSYSRQLISKVTYLQHLDESIAIVDNAKEIVKYYSVNYGFKDVQNGKYTIYIANNNVTLNPTINKSLYYDSAFQACNIEEIDCGYQNEIEVDNGTGIFSKQKKLTIRLFRDNKSIGEDILYL